MYALRHSSLRTQARAICRRNASTTYVPPASAQYIQPPPPPSKKKPASPNFLSGRAKYYDTLDNLETAIQHSQRTLRNLQLLPLPTYAKAALPQVRTVWMTKEGMSEAVGHPLTTSRHRRIISLLTELNTHRRLAEAGGYSDLSNGIGSLLIMFEKANKDAVLARGIKKPVKFDTYGRTYTVGKRKTSSARVWIIPVKQPALTKAASDAVPVPATSEPAPVTTTTILVNNTPLSEYFTLPADREKIVRPFKLAGLLGAYNVFALVRGGGTTGQAGALAQGIAKGLAAHVPDVEPVLRRCTLPEIISLFLGLTEPLQPN
jgi:small subunit ribosomal protein S9